jgi:uncharacterized protein (TIGR02246 family)
MSHRPCWFLSAVAWITFAATITAQTLGQDDPVVAEITALSKKFADAFNAQKIDEAAALFAEQCELIDEHGVVYRGRDEIKALIKAFHERFPDSQIGEEVESIRKVGPLAVKEGVRIMANKGGDVVSRMRFITTYAKGDDSWQVVSVRDFGDEHPATPGEMLKALEWLIGDWINEGADARVKITFRWSDDKNFILGDFHVKNVEGVESHSTQRIGWDPRVNKPHSWMFDSDGGFGEGDWTQVDDGWIVNSSAVMPDGLTGSATLKFVPGDEGRFVIAGMNRIVGDQLEGDFEITIVKQPPSPGK